MRGYIMTEDDIIANYGYLTQDERAAFEVAAVAYREARARATELIENARVYPQSV